MSYFNLTFSQRILLSLLLLSGDVETNPGPQNIPTLKAVIEKLTPVQRKWRNICISLGVSYEMLDKFEEQAQSDGTNPFIEAVDYWLEGNTDISITWGTIVSALESKFVSECGLAKELRDTCVVSGINPSDGQEDNNNPHHKRITRLKRCFNALKFRLLDYLQREKKTLSEVINILVKKYPMIQNSSQGCDKLSDLFETESRIWSFFLYQPIKLLIVSLVDDEHRLQSQLTDYIQEFLACAEHPVFECPIFGTKKEGEAVIVFDIEEITFQKLSLKGLGEFHRSLNSVICSHHLTLLAINKDCSQMTFRISSQTGKEISEFSQETLVALKDIGVIRATYKGLIYSLKDHDDIDKEFSSDKSPPAKRQKVSGSPKCYKGSSSSHSPTVSNHPPVVSSHSPTVSNRPTVISSHSPTVSNRPPVVSSHSPMVSNCPPVVSNCPPVVSSHSPTVSNRPPPPAVSNHQPVICKHPLMVDIPNTLTNSTVPSIASDNIPLSSRANNLPAQAKKTAGQRRVMKSTKSTFKVEELPTKFILDKANKETKGTQFAECQLKSKHLCSKENYMKCTNHKKKPKEKCLTWREESSNEPTQQKAKLNSIGTCFSPTSQALSPHPPSASQQTVVTGQPVPARSSLSSEKLGSSTVLESKIPILSQTEVVGFTQSGHGSAHHPKLQLETFSNLSLNQPQGATPTHLPALLHSTPISHNNKEKTHNEPQRSTSWQNISIGPTSRPLPAKSQLGTSVSKFPVSSSVTHNITGVADLTQSDDGGAQHSKAPPSLQSGVCYNEQHSDEPFQPQDQTAKDDTEACIEIDSEIDPEIDPEIDAKLNKAANECIIKLHITKCGVNGPSGTGKSHFRAQMCALPCLSKRQSTAIATKSDQVTLDFNRITDPDDLLEMKKNCKGTYEWKIIKKDSMARFLANTVHNEDYEISDHSNPESSRSSDTSQLDNAPRKNSKFTSDIKHHLSRMKGKPKRKRKGMNGIQLIYFVDVGGQPQFQEILPKFVRNSVHFLVHNLSQDLSECPNFSYVVDGKTFTIPEKLQESNLTIIEQSVRSIASTFTPSVSGSSPVPHVAFIGTFKDKCRPDTPGYEKMLRDKSQQINECLKPYTAASGPNRKCNIFSPDRGKEQRIFAIDGSEEGWNTNSKCLDKLKGFIREYASKKPIDVPIKYFIFLQDIKAYAKKKKLSYITLDECNTVATSSGISMTEADIKKSLKLFNEVGRILYFPTVLEEIVFIKPEFLFEKITNLIVASFQCEDDDDILNEERKFFHTTGIFNNQILEHAQSLQFSDPNFTKQKFLQLLKGLLIIVELGQGEYFMPCVLPVEVPTVLTERREFKETITCMQQNKISGPLMISFAHKLSPRGLFCSVVVALLGISCWKLQRLDRCFRYRNLAEFDFYLSSARRFVGTVAIIDKNSHLEVYTTCEEGKFCQDIRHTLNKALIIACSSMSYTVEDLGVDIGLPCTMTCNVSEVHASSIHHNEEKGRWMEKCSVNHRKRAIPLTPDRAVWFDCIPHGDASGAQNVLSLRLLMDEVSTRTNKWEGIAVNLDIPINDIERISMECNNSVEDCFLRVFSLWERKCYPPYKWDTIVNVLESPTVEEMYLAREI